MHYLLLNKDTVWLAFHCEQNECFMETAAGEDAWYTAQAPKHRAHIAALLKEPRLQIRWRALNVTHFTAVHWVRGGR